MQTASTTLPTRRPWFWPAAAYTAAWVACLVAVESVVIALMKRRIVAACEAEEDALFFCGVREAFELYAVVLVAYFLMVMAGASALAWIRQHRLPESRSALIVAFVTVLGQVAVCVLAMLTRGADHLTVVWGMLWLAAPMVGMRMWLLSGEPASAGVSVSGG